VQLVMSLRKGPSGSQRCGFSPISWASREAASITSVSLFVLMVFMIAHTTNIITLCWYGNVALQEAIDDIR
jgi:uncharacterized protein involved in cysteine biosynthesis